ncbi:CoA transferase [Micromonospora sp. 4G57]|uniref:CoA transferase n=1 Tax=Micromonospora sicca TaxID=2202420 RepID=A0ABU5JM45_9ACTN|nr:MULTISPECIES: CoA transferase [unclassified Micromonospora]MDZ5446367.1 CoA transferase [Micromonospora sp. 4G57]MDZ5493444.1 CoA transferase [Micromonospora sp. 4G53]
MTPAPLRGLRVVDLSQYIAGSVCGQLLADFGAEVTKVEPLGGDPSRALTGTAYGSLWFRSYNTGKQSVRLDLRDPDDRARLNELLADAHAVVSNFARRTRERLGLDAATLHRAYPELVVTTVSAYGADDPRTCFDSIAQAVSGFAAVNADEAGRPRISAGYPTDVFCGMYAGFSTAMALLDRPVRGVEIDVPMEEIAMTALAGPAFLSAAEAGTVPRGRGDRDAATCPSGIYPCADGFAYVYAGLDKHWALLRPLVDGPLGALSERLRDPGPFDAAVTAWTSRLCVAEVCKTLDALGVPAGPVLDPVTALAGITARRPGAVVALEADGEAVPQYPVTFNGQRPARTPAPAQEVTR